MLNHKGTMKIETDRLILRQFTNDDAEDMFKNWCSDNIVTKYLSWDTHEYIDDTKKVLSEWIENYSQNNYYNWCITLRGENKPIGSVCAFNVCETNERCEIGYCIGRDFWGRGIMTEVLEELIKFFINDVGIHRVQLKHDTENPASGRVMQKAGMVYESRFNEFVKRKDGSFGNLDMYYITKNILQANSMEHNKDEKS